MIEDLRHNIRELNALAEIYSDLKEKRVETPEEVDSVKNEMRIVKERMLSIFLDTKKMIKKEERAIEDEERTAVAD